MSETPETRNLEDDVEIIKSPLETPVYSEAEHEMVEDEGTFTEAPWRQEQTDQTDFL